MTELVPSERIALAISKSKTKSKNNSKGASDLDQASPMVGPARVPLPKSTNPTHFHFRVTVSGAGVHGASAFLAGPAPADRETT